jgi:hypothetical protein
LDVTRTMKGLAQTLLCVLALVGVTPLADAGQIWHDTRVWALSGPGGAYGLVESEGLGVGVGHPERIETTVCVGPLHFGVPCSAPATLCFLVLLLFIPAAALFWFMRHRAARPSL